MAKRARERARQERQAAKRERRQSGAPTDAGANDAADEAVHMERFRILSERHAAGTMTDDAYAEERHRIFVALGIETDSDV